MRATFATVMKRRKKKKENSYNRTAANWRLVLGREFRVLFPGTARRESASASFLLLTRCEPRRTFWRLWPGFRLSTISKRTSTRRWHSLLHFTPCSPHQAHTSQYLSWVCLLRSSCRNGRGLWLQPCSSPRCTGTSSPSRADSEFCSPINHMCRPRCPALPVTCFNM